VLVDEPGRFVIVIVCGGQEGFKIADTIKWETELFFKGLKFEGAIVGITACGGLRIHSGVWRSRMSLEEKGWKHPLHTYVRL